MTIITKRKLLKKIGFEIDTSNALGTSDVKVPSQKAVKEYVDANAGGGGTKKAMSIAATF